MKAYQYIKKIITDQSGNSTILFMIIITLLLGAMSFATDAGMLYLEKLKLQNAVDGAALAGVSKAQEGEIAILSAIYDNAAKNGVSSSQIVVELQSNNKKVIVTAQKKVKLYFARLFSKTEATVNARAAAVIAPIAATNGIKPIGIEQQELVFGQSYILKHGAGDGFTGNYGALALGGSGASNYKQNLLHGYYGDLEVGDLVKIGYTVDTEPGNMEGPTYDAITQIIKSDSNVYTDLSKLPVNSPRRFIVPVIDSFDVHGRDTVKIVGFAAFFLEDVVYQGGKTQIKGKFIKTLSQGEIDENSPSYGLYGIKLVE